MTVHTTPSAAAQTAIPAIALEGVLPTAPTYVPRQKLSLRKALLMGAAIVALGGASWYGYDYWTVGQYLVSTDDAYVKADNTTIAPRVSGYLGSVLVGDNERVKAGQALAQIDERDFRVARDQAKADVAAKTDAAAHASNANRRKRGGRGWTAEMRKKAADRMKAYWAKRKRQRP